MITQFHRMLDLCKVSEGYSGKTLSEYLWIGV
jgi:hypothetical protein